MEIRTNLKHTVSDFFEAELQKRGYERLEGIRFWFPIREEIQQKSKTEYELHLFRYFRELEDYKTLADSDINAAVTFTLQNPEDHLEEYCEEYANEKVYNGVERFLEFLTFFNSKL